MNKRTFLVSPSSRKTSYRSRIVGSDDFSCEKEEREKKRKKSSKKCQTSGLLFERLEGRQRVGEREREREREWQAVIRTKTTAMRGTKATQTAFPHVRSECP